MSAFTDALAKFAAAMGYQKTTVASATTALNASKTQAAQIAALNTQVKDLQAQVDAATVQLNTAATDINTGIDALAAAMKP